MTPAPIPLQQHPNFAAALTLLGRPPLTLANGHLMLTRPFPGGLRLNLLSRAALPAPEALPDLLGPHRAPLILSPEHPAPGLARLGAVPLMTPATLAEIPLADPGTMRAALHPKWRNRLKQAELLNLRVTIQPMPPDPMHWLLAAEDAQRRARRYRGWPRMLTVGFVAANPSQARLFTAHRNGAPLAAMLFLRHGEAATYHIGHTTGDGRAASAHTLLMWQAMLWHAARGCRSLDLGLIDTDRAAGLARFKLGAGAVPRTLGGTWGWWPRLGPLLAPLARLDATMAGKEHPLPASSLS